MEVLIRIEGNEWAKALDDVFKEKNKTAKIDGFRPGKAPKDVFIKKYGIESLYMEATEKCFDLAYEKMIKQNENIEIVARPEVSINSVDSDHIEYKFVLTLKPAIKLGKYTDLKVKKESIEVTKEEVAEALESMRTRFTENVDKEGVISNGDIAVIDFEGFKDGVLFDGGQGVDYSLKVGSNTFIPGFEDQLIGVAKGSEVEVNVTFPDDYHEESLKGAPVVFKVKVKEIKEPKLPELNEDFFLDLGMEGINSKETLEKQLEENLRARKDFEIENKYIDTLLETASKNVKVDIPDIMIKEETDRMIEQYEQQIKMQGISLEMFYQFTQSNEETLREQMKEEATKRITYRLMLEAIALEEKIEVTDEDAEKEAEVLAEKHKMTKEELLNTLGSLDMVKYDMKMRKAMEVLKQ